MKKANDSSHHNHSHGQNRFSVMPAPLRLGAVKHLTGKGVTIAFLDSGFYPHPDLTETENRILAFEDISGRRSTLNQYGAPKSWDWHGTQTSVVATGNGHLSDGAYRGIASDAQVVLVKVGAEGRITEEHIASGIRWVIENKDRYAIRIINISLGGDEDIPHKESLADCAAEEAIRKGLIVVAAAGNTGCTPDHHTRPPANSPSVITVGGYDDKNQFGEEDFGIYCSSFGPTADGIVKPEIIAPAIWIAAPILPDTNLYDRAEALSFLEAQPDYLLTSLARSAADPDSQLSETARDAWENASLPESLAGESAETIRTVIEAAIKKDKIVAAHYQHVDGTSFAAPIVSSVIAQMLEANPTLSPGAVKHILISTASRIAGAPLMWQGYGVLRARQVIEMASSQQQPLDDDYFRPPLIEGEHLVFFYHNEEAKSVSLAGDFNGWDPERANFKRDGKGVWRAEIPIPSPGRYSYKLVVNGQRWVEDPSNGLKEPDNHGGLNSVLDIK